MYTGLASLHAEVSGNEFMVGTVFQTIILVHTDLSTSTVYYFAPLAIMSWAFMPEGRAVQISGKLGQGHHPHFRVVGSCLEYLNSALGF